MLAWQDLKDAAGAAGAEKESLPSFPWKKKKGPSGDGVNGQRSFLWIIWFRRIYTYNIYIYIYVSLYVPR